MKAILRQALAALHGLSGLSRFEHRGATVVLMYHRVIPEDEARRESVQPGMYVSPECFRAQLAFLAARFRVVDFAELLAEWDGRTAPRPEPRCVITFDDGWLDNYVHAFPLLRARHLPATVFLPTAYIGTERWFWPERVTWLLEQADGIARAQLGARFPWWAAALAGAPQDAPATAEAVDAVIVRLKERHEDEIESFLDAAAAELGAAFPRRRLCVDWDEVTSMSEGGIRFGSHTANHRILTLQPLERVRQELSDSLAELRRRRLSFTPVFSYPNGAFNPAIAELVAECGYAAAVSTACGHLRSGAPPERFAIPRVGVHQDISRTATLFGFHLSPLGRKLLALGRRAG